MKEKIKKWYELGLWTDEMVRDAVDKGVIKPGDYETITGKTYEEVPG